MAAQSLSPWIADLVREEINAILTWQTNKDNHIKVEEEWVGRRKRFHNDGSNFRNVVSETEPGRSEVQLIEVLGSPTTTGVKVVISDGHTRMKAQLTSGVVDILEAELDEKLGEETTNDVFRLKTFVIVSTGVGSAEDWIQLTIEEIEYLYHRRRNLGQPTPIEHDSNIQPLITDIATLLNPKPEADEQGNDAVHSQELQSEPASVAVQRSSPTSVPASQIERSPVERPPVHKRRKPQQTLEDDGFEVRRGVNLQGPVKAKRKDDGKLLGLLKGERPRAEIVVETPVRPLDRGNIQGRGLFAGMASGAPQSRNSSPEDMDVDESPPPGNHEQPQDLRSSPPAPKTPPSSHSRWEGHRLNPSQARGSRLSGEPRGSPRVSTRADSPESTRPSNQPKSTRSTQVKSRIPYGRRKIPANQRALLSKETSWLPSLPGCRFPKPNVPIELLTKWNAAPSLPSKSTAASNRERTCPSQEPQEDESSKSPSDSSDDSDEMLSSSQWPASPAQTRPRPRPDLPPDSSIEHVVRGTPDELEVEPPRALKASKSAQRVAERPSNSAHPLPRRPPVPIPEATDARLLAEKISPAKPSPIRHTQRLESPRIPPSSAPPSSNHAPSSRNGASRPVPSSSNPSPILPGLRSTAHQTNTGALPSTQRPPPSSSRPPSTLPGLHLTGRNPSRHADPPARPSQDLNGRSHPPHPAHQASRSSQTARPAPVPPRESIHQTKAAWRDQNRKQQERLKAESMVPENDAMREFVSSFLNIRPGGAFASKNGDASQSLQRRQVDVLAWNI